MKKTLLTGEFIRKVDERNRLSLPNEFIDAFRPEDGNCLIVKERPGCVSLWERSHKSKQDARIELIQQRLKIGDLEHRTPELQALGRLLSTREKPVQIDARGRFVLPEGFREFLGVESGKDVMIVGALVSLEIWNPEKWITYIEENIPKYQELMTQLSH